MKVKVVVKRYAYIDFDIWEFKVHENGYVERQEAYTGKWLRLAASDFDYELVREVGLNALGVTSLNVLKEAK